MFWQDIKDREPASFKRLSGVSKKTFRLMVRAVVRFDEKIIAKKGNHRSRPFTLCVEDQVLLTLMYYREYRTQFHIGGTYGMSESAVCRTIQRVVGVLEKINEFKLPGKRKLSGTSQQVSAILIDATEMAVERPKKNNSGTIRVRKRSIR